MHIFVALWRSVRRSAWRPVCWLLAGIVAGSAGCSATEVERLEGDPPAVAAFTVPVSRRTHPAVDGCQRFVAAVRAGDSAAAWNQLSGDTQKALNGKGKPAGLRGVELLQWRRWPKGDTMQGGEAFDPLALFAVTQVNTLQLVATPADNHNVAQNLELTDVANRKRTVHMRFEGFAWRIHNPALSL